MRKISAHRIYPVSSPPISFGIIEIADDGTILNVRNTGGRLAEEAGLEFYSGIIVPGLINAHCHLELSHLSGLIPQCSGISSFVSAITKLRAGDPEKIRLASIEADRKMYLEGVSGAGDISNTEITLPIKQNSRILYNTFIEVYGLDKEKSTITLEQAILLAKKYNHAGLAHSITPHAPYSVGIDLWELLSRTCAGSARISIHHGESPEERELLENRTGLLFEYLRASGFDLTRIPHEAPDIFKLLAKYLPDPDWLLVHNTVSGPNPSKEIKKSGVFWVLCPRSNLYIENLLPDFMSFAASDVTICLGTDSLASNISLSIVEEMKTIMMTAPEITFDSILQWATLNGARALGMEQTLGTIEPGKKPGLVYIPDFNWNSNRLQADSRSIRLI